MKGRIFTAALLASLISSIGLTSLALCLHLSIDYYLATIGTVVTSLAFGFGTYFVVIAIDAYGQLQIVRGSAESAEKLAGTLKFREAQINDLQKDFLSLQKGVSGVGERLHHSAEKILQIVVEYVLSIPGHTKNRDLVRERLLRQAHCIRNRFLIESEFTEKEAKRMAVLSLMNYNDVEAAPLIQNLLDSSEDTLLRDTCQMALRTIREKM